MIHLRRFRGKPVLAAKVSFFTSHATSLHLSLEASAQLLLSNQHEDVISLFKERADVSMDGLHPLEKNIYALGLLFNGDKEHALEIQSQTVKSFTRALGSTNDFFYDVAGSINDLAVIHLANKDYLSAEKQLKRALLMVERSYRIDNHLRSTLLANLSNVHRITGNKESCLQYTDSLLPLLNSNHQYKKLDAVDLTTLNPAENQESLDKFWKSLTETKIKEMEKQSVRDSQNVNTRDRFYYTRQVFTSVRQIQFTLFVGHTIGTCRLHEEGLVYFNKAFEMMLLRCSQQQNGDFALQDSFLLSSSLSKLADLADDSTKVRGKGISAKHIQLDNLSLLFQLPLFKTKFPCITDLDLTLSSPYRDLKNAATQVYKSRVISHNNSEYKSKNSNLSEFEMTQLSGSGIVGIALLDIEHHCPPLPPASPATSDHATQSE